MPLGNASGGGAIRWRQLIVQYRRKKLDDMEEVGRSGSWLRRKKKKRGLFVLDCAKDSKPEEVYTQTNPHSQLEKGI